MNEDALIYSYELFKNDGYSGSIDQYKQLISSDKKALDYSYNLFKNDGYSGSLDDFSGLIRPAVELSVAEEVKKNEDTVSPFVDGGLEPTEFDQEESIVIPDEAKPVEESEKKGGKSYLSNLATSLGLGLASANEAIASIPESVINILAIPQNYIAEKTGLPISVTAEGIKKSWGITNPLLDYVQEEKKILSGEVSRFMAERYEDPSIVGNFQKGNYQDGFELLGSAITQSVPISLGLMAGGAYVAPLKLATVATLGFTEAQREELGEMDPTMSEAEKTLKAAGMAAAESVFSSISTGTIGKVYRDIAKREGAEAAKGILKDGLVKTYKKALEKTGVVAGFVGEGIEEAATQITQNVIAGRPAFEGAADAFVTGAGSGVVFTAPISAINAKRYIGDKVESINTKSKIGQILGDKANDIDMLYNVPVASEITVQQLEVANLPKSREILVSRLEKAVSDNKITEDDAKQSLFVFDKTQQVSNSVKDLDVSAEDKAKIATLLRQRDELKTKIQNKDDVLVVQEKQKIEQINSQIQEILSGPKQETPTYKVDGKDVTADVIDELIKTKSREELLAMDIQIENDTEGRVERFQEVIGTKPIEPQAPAEASVQKEVSSDVFDLKEIGKNIKPADLVRFQELSESLREGELLLKDNVDPSGNKLTAEKRLQIEKSVESTKQKIQSLSSQEGKVQEVETLRAQEQAELTEALTDAEQYMVDGKIDGEKTTDPAEKKIFDDIYDKYDKLITPLIEGDLAVQQEAITPEIITEEASLIDNDFDEEGDLTDEGFAKAENSLKSIVEQEANNAGIPVEILLKHYNINSRGEYFSSTTPILRVSESNNYQRVIKTLKDISFKMFPDRIDELNEQINNYSQDLFDAYERGDKGVAINKSHGKLLSALDNINSKFNEFLKPQERVSLAEQQATPEAAVQEDVESSKEPSEFALELENKYDVEIDLLGGLESETLSVSRIVVPKEQRGKGVGAKVMEEIIQFADSNNKKLVLTPSKDFGGTSVKRLTDFYKRFGFVENKGKNKDFTIRDTMYRSPEGTIQEESDPKKPRPISKKKNREEIISRPAFTPIAIARQWLLSGGKLRTIQSEANKTRGVGIGKGVREETGMSGVEMRQLVGVIDNKRGLSPEVAAERIYEGLSPELQASMDIQDIRNSLIEVLSSEDRNTWLENQDRETSEVEMSGFDEYIYNQLTDQERADYDQYKQEESYNEYRQENAKKLASEYDAYIKSKVYQDYIEETYERDRESRPDAQDKDDGRGKKQSADEGSDPVQKTEQATEVVGKLDELLKLDPKEKGAGQKALDYLDGLIKDYDDIQSDGLGVNIALPAIKAMLKGIRALVQTGVNLNDAIKRIAKENNFSVKDVVSGINAVSQILPIQKEFDALMTKANTLINTQKSKDIDQKKIVSNLDTMVRNSEVYKNANDAQRKIMELEARVKAGVGPRKAASIGRVIGVLKDITNVSRKEKLQIISRIRELGRDVAKDLTAEIRALNKTGKISLTQATNIISRLGDVNMLNEKSVVNFINYMTKVFADANYNASILKARDLRKSIKRLSKNKEKNANLRDLSQKFGKIDPSMVDDINAYNDMAAKIKSATEGSSTRKSEVNFAQTVNIENATQYIEKTIEAQKEFMLQQKADEIQNLMDVDVSDLSYEDMMMMLDPKVEITKYNEGIIRGLTQKAFDSYSSIIKKTLKTGKDPFTGEAVSFTDSQRDVITRFMGMDLSLLKPREALQAVDALANFFENKSTAKMEAVISTYTGSIGPKKLLDRGIIAQQLKKYWSPKLARLLGEQATNQNILFERMFKGFTKAGLVEDAMGITDLKNGKSLATSQSNAIVERYVDQFYKKEANGQAFNTEYNSVERGLAAFMTRNVIGSEAAMQTEFNRRKRLVKESIKVLSEGNEKEKTKSKIYQEAYDKLVSAKEGVSKESSSINDVKDRVDKTNLEAVEWWNNEWSDKFDELSDVSLNVYNKVLDKDLNYTPDKYSRLSQETGTVELSNEDSAFHGNSGAIYKKETGVLMEATKPGALPRNEKSGDVSRYIDLSFDQNNSNAMYDALVDIKTAGPIRQIEGFLNSPDFKKVVPTSEDARILKDRVQLYVSNIRNKNPYSNDELSSAIRGLNRIANIGVGQALGGVFQPVKQVVPVALNTLINAGDLNIGSVFNSSINSFINNSGYSIASRGIESQAQVDSLNKLIDEASKSKGDVLIKKIEGLNKFWLEELLVKPDVFIARASWMSYYQQSLKKQGIEPSGIDYSTHKINKEAGNYAQRMLDRQQNVSDIDLAGKLFSGKEPLKQVFIKMLMPFSSFRMNQSARLGSDLAVISDKTATVEDKKIAIRSLSGFAVEMVTFRAISAGITVLIGTVAKMALGQEESEEEFDKRVDNAMKGQVTSSFNDIFSPLPLLDKPVQRAGNYLTETVLEIPRESIFSIFNVPKQEYIQSLGLLGISTERAGQLYDLSKLSVTGKYTDDFGKEKEISKENKEALGYMIGPAILTNIGLAPTEVNSVIRNSIKYAKKGEKKPGKTDVEKSLEVVEKNKKLKDLRELKEKTRDEDELKAIRNKIIEMTGSDEAKEAIDAERKALTERKKKLLYDSSKKQRFNTESDMKRLNPSLWRKRFGPNSDWSKDTKAKKVVENKLSKIRTKRVDREFREKSRN